MPTTYAHWRFGEHCIKTLPDNLQKIINNNRHIFDFGVHGPDIFFYYSCLKRNAVNDYGYLMHRTPFEYTLKEIRPHFLEAENKESLLAYLLGFTCHFALDSYCHGYIELISETTDVTHGRLESQYDRHLLIKDGFDPVKKNRYFSIKPSKKIAHDISTIFLKFDEKTTYKIIKDQLFYLRLLTDDFDLKRSLLIATMKKVNASSFIDLLITKENDPRCEIHILRLDKYFKKAVEHYKELAESMIAYMNDGTELIPYFHNNFNHKEDYKKIPVLSLEEELLYKANKQE